MIAFPGLYAGQSQNITDPEETKSALYYIHETVPEMVILMLPGVTLTIPVV